MPSILITNLPPVPPRTLAKIFHPLPPSGSWVINGEYVFVRYECLDCSFATTSQRIMAEHQEHHWRYHNLYQRLRRFWLRCRDLLSLS